MSVIGHADRAKPLRDYGVGLLLPRERMAIGRAPTTSVEAYTSYLKGREYLHRGTKSYYGLAKRMFNKAIALDPAYARAYAGLADCDAFLYMDYSEDVADDVLRNSELALALESDLVEARAEREFEKNPENPRPAYFIATTLAKMGEASRAERWANTALAIAPEDYLTRYNIACYYSVSGKLDPAFALLGELLPLSNTDMKSWILSDSDFDPLHVDPRWENIRRLAQNG